ncbi:MAG: chemotaxis response regulator protein-glutamate methylesterase [Halieaceae bacterium]|jgi:two-component system, chemotaxis family, protein-glutamate methylesterase/glutaminase|nr:chemotaxis response regulator protein-glutamate methylesterase [Halieaceae bacterium]
MSIRVLIVDDSALVRKVLSDILKDAAGIEVMGTAQDPIFAQSKMESDWPDVVLLDVEMPRMDGITFLKKIMRERPTPVVMCSTLTEAGSKTSVQALSIGAIDVVAKPKADLKTSLPEASHDLIAAIRVAAKANMAGAKPKPITPLRATEKKLTADAMLSKTAGRARPGTKTWPLVAIGASTGGTQALEAVLTALPAHTLPILIVQHMPEAFTGAFADRLNKLCKVQVKEAQDNDALLPGRVLIAPGGKHMMLQATQFGASVQVKDGPLVSRHKPSVDVLFRSVSKYGSDKVLGIIMTGMGDDGAKGMKEMHDAGVKTIAQDQATCVVYGMPQVAVQLGGVDLQAPLRRIPELIMAHK